MQKCLNNKRVSFVVPLFNHVEQTKEMLRSLLVSLPQGLNYEVIFADDASTDGTRDWLAGLSDARIQIVLNERNFGYAKTNNAAVARASGHYLALLNNDLLFEPGWFEPMLAALDAPSLNAGIVGNLQCRVLDKVLDHAGVVLTPRGQFDHIRTEPNQAAEAIEVYVATGACMLMRRVDFEAVGGFDEVFVNGCEDIDLCLKIREAGQQIYVEPRSRILHHVSLSRSCSNIQNEKNSHYLFSKWRKQIKLQLTKCWIDLLGEPQHEYPPYLDGALTPQFKSRPHIAAMTVAEAALLREEARWAKELALTAIHGDWFKRVQTTGLTAVAKARGFLAAHEFEVSIDALKTACNFYVCGRLLSDFEPERMALTVSVNNSQEKFLRFETGRSVNVGVINPLITSTGKNTFKVNVFFIDGNGQPTGAANNAMLLTHLVVDDQVVRDFSV